VWPAGLEHEIERALGAGERSVSTLLSSVGASAIDLPASHPVYRPDLLINLNDLGDLEAAGVTQRPALRTGGRP
jgi:molybdopterin-guanine dinucleotide biosynthesis protein A